MDNRILQVEVRDRSLVPAEAEVWITVTPERQTPTTEIRGRLMGPRCAYAGTVEVAYPLRPLPPDRAGQSPPLTRRVVVPEACLWEPECPFLYQGPIELWQDGQCRDRFTLSHGLRSFQLGEGGLRVNGRPLTLHGRTVKTLSEVDARTLRQAGCNLLVASIEENTLSLWEVADRLGFLILGRIVEDSEQTRRFLDSASRHASCLGWLVADGEYPPFHLLPQAGLVGLECVAMPRASSFSMVHFVFGSAMRTNLGKPLLVKGETPIGSTATTAILGNVVSRS